jgi:hypothetical protein
MVKKKFRGGGITDHSCDYIGLKPQKLPDTLKDFLDGNFSTNEEGIQKYICHEVNIDDHKNYLDFLMSFMTDIYTCKLNTRTLTEILYYYDDDEGKQQTKRLNVDKYYQLFESIPDPTTPASIRSISSAPSTPLSNSSLNPLATPINPTSTSSPSIPSPTSPFTLLITTNCTCLFKLKCSQYDIKYIMENNHESMDENEKLNLIYAMTSVRNSLPLCTNMFICPDYEIVHNYYYKIIHLTEVDLAVRSNEKVPLCMYMFAISYEFLENYLKQPSTKWLKSFKKLNDPKVTYLNIDSVRSDQRNYLEKFDVRGGFYLPIYWTVRYDNWAGKLEGLIKLYQIFRERMNIKYFLHNFIYRVRQAHIRGILIYDYRIYKLFFGDLNDPSSFAYIHENFDNRTPPDIIPNVFVKNYLKDYSIQDLKKCKVLDLCFLIKFLYNIINLYIKSDAQLTTDSLGEFEFVNPFPELAGSDNVPPEDIISITMFDTYFASKYITNKGEKPDIILNIIFNNIENYLWIQFMFLLRSSPEHYKDRQSLTWIVYNCYRKYVSIKGHLEEGEKYYHEIDINQLRTKYHFKDENIENYQTIMSYVYDANTLNRFERNIKIFINFMVKGFKERVSEFINTFHEYNNNNETGSKDSDSWSTNTDTPKGWIAITPNKNKVYYNVKTDERRFDKPKEEDELPDDWVMRTPQYGAPFYCNTKLKTTSLIRPRKKKG